MRCASEARAGLRDMLILLEQKRFLKDGTMNDRQAAAKIEMGPVVDAAINCGFYFFVFLSAVSLDRLYPFQTGLSYVLVSLPYLLVIGFILLRREVGAPRFEMGDAAAALVRFFFVWVALLLIALIFAYNNGMSRMSAMTGVGLLKTFGSVVGAPLAIELVFRGALLTSLNKTNLGRIGVLSFPASVVAGAVIFSVLRCMIYMVAGYGFGDAALSGSVALLMGLVFGAIYVQTGNIWYGVFLHGLVNLAQWN